ncbi:sulfite exporter TauE/SafE family protein [Silanimonas sp.]|uniref:sulfite exporter TauE/SafE family protein n=1 Tax=Silanimonas sp. TaxID=1929290 RepID=UPI0022C35EEC|nr:sulfite exporter TauE/SafE family protein [Silanimonas sp.]MCZ8062081.1 sulfite exporter TauE/SafE family protein [Silanimonas sp.]
MIWLALLGAMIVGLSLGLLGSGGSILTVPLLVYLVGQPEKVAIAGSLAVVGGIALAGAIPSALRGGVEWRSVGWFGVPGMLGTVLGAHLSRWIPGDVQLLLFAAVMLVAAWRMARAAPASTATGTPRSRTWIVIDGLGVGLLTGLVGVGGGFMIVPALVLLGGLPMQRAIATSLWIIALNAFSGFAKHLFVLDAAGLALDWTLLALFTAVGAMGSLVGQKLASRLPQALLRRGFAALLVVMGLYIVGRELPTLLAS